MKLLKLVPDNTNIDFMKVRNIALLLSILVTAASLALVAVKGGYDWATQVEIERLIAASWLAYSEGKHEESLRLMRAAADLDDKTEKHPVTPGAILPAREQLGELLDRTWRRRLRRPRRLSRCRLSAATILRDSDGGTSQSLT